MNDHELDRLVATATHVRDSWVEGFDLRAAEDELLEEIMATTDSDAPERAGVEPPPSEPAQFASRPGRFKLTVAIGVAAALVVAVVLVRSVGGDRDVGTSDQPTIQPMIADPIPEGTDVAMVEPFEGTEPIESDEVETVVFGEVTETAVRNDVVISVGTAAPASGARVTVRGQDGQAGTYSDGDGVVWVSWTEPSDVQLTMYSRSFDREQVLTIAEGLEVDGADIELGDVPSGVAKPPKVAELPRLEGEGYTVGYFSDDDPGPSFHVRTRAVDDEDRAYELWMHGPRDDGQVQGHDLVLDAAGGGLFTMAWEPAPGQVVEVLAQGVDEASARAFAETIRPASEADWTALQEELASNPVEEPVVGPPPDDALHRELANGAEVWTWLGGDGLCYRNRYADGGENSLCPGDTTAPALGVSPSYDNDELLTTVPAVVGIAPADTESIDGGDVTFGEEAEGGWIYIWESEVEGEMPPDTLTFRDADGNVISTVEVLTI